MRGCNFSFQLRETIVPYHTKIFLFFTNKTTGEGTGLGLSLCYDIITKVHGGKLLVKSEENSYTEFTIELPA